MKGRPFPFNIGLPERWRCGWEYPSGRCRSPRQAFRRFCERHAAEYDGEPKEGELLEFPKQEG